MDAGLAGCWNSMDTKIVASVLSRSGYVIIYAGCPLFWSSKMKTEIALSMTEAEYIALSQSMQEFIPLIGLLKEISAVFGVVQNIPEMNCT